jgi:hypothetical protein
MALFHATCRAAELQPSGSGVVHRNVDTAESNISQAFRGTNAHRLIVSGGRAGRESQGWSYSSTTLANAQILTRFFSPC